MKDPRIEVDFRSSDEATAKGGIFAIKAFAQQCGLWKRIEAQADLDPRKDKSKGYDAKVYVATFLFGFASGGASMADFEKLNDEPGLKRFWGIKRFPDETTLGQWMRSIGQKGAEMLMQINRDFIAWAMERIQNGRLLHCDHLDWFFDDTQLEVTGKCFEAAALNYEGNTSLSWQTLWAGPFLAAGCLGAGSRDCSELLPEQLEQCAALLRLYPTYLYADSGSSAGKYINRIAKSVDQFSISYNKWTEGPQLSGALKNCLKLNGAPKRRFVGGTAKSTGLNTLGCVISLRVATNLNCLPSHGINLLKVNCSGATASFAAMATAAKTRKQQLSAINLKGTKSVSSRRCCAIWTCTILPAKA